MTMLISRTSQRVYQKNHFKLLLINKLYDLICSSCCSEPNIQGWFVQVLFSLKKPTKKVLTSATNTTLNITYIKWI